MWLNKKNYKALYDEELKKQTDAYSYYIDNVEHKISEKIYEKEGEHENVPLICIKEEDIAFVSEDECYRIFECGDYFIYESKKGTASAKEKAELVTNAIKLNSDLIYSDVDHITCDGKRTAPFYKPSFGIDTAKCFDYFTDFYAVKKMKSRIDISLLETISHVSKVLFHYSAQNNTENFNETYALNNDSYLTNDFYLNYNGYEVDKDKISVIIPSKDNPGILKTCLKGIAWAKIKSGINVLEVVIVDNGSTDSNRATITHDIKEITEETTGINIKYLYDKAEFNFSGMCNNGADNSTGSYLLFMNDDIEVTDGLFFLKLLYFAQMNHVGAVGCKLLYPGEERRIQHVGITNLKHAGPSHKLSTFEDNKWLYFGRNRGIHDVLAVTGACLMVSREKYFKIGGFHDKMKVGYNDVDLCVSLYEQGLMNVVNNECVLIHHESISRGSDAANESKLKRLDDERNLLYDRHPWLLKDTDPFYNVNLAEDFLDYRVNVIPEFERRDYVSEEREHLNSYVAKRQKKIANDETDKGLFFNLESIRHFRHSTELTGWALINKKDNYLYDIYVAVMDSDGEWHAFDTARVYREDLSSVFPEAGYTKLSGFFARIPEGIAERSKDNRFGILLINKQTGKKYYAGFTKSDI